MAPLDEYRKKRDFRKTPEPSGDARKSRRGEGGRFVIQKHDATRLHYDLRLEQDGVFKSWAVPKGLGRAVGEKRLAVQVEDHPLEYGDFEGVIPQGEYGGGTVMLWDRGRWRPKGKLSEHHIDFELDGSKLKGTWTLVRMRSSADEEGNDWLLIKRDDDWEADSAGKKISRTGKKRGRLDNRQLQADTSEETGDSDRSVATGRTMKQIARDKDATWTSTGRAEEIDAAPPPAKSLDGAKKRALPKELQPQLASLVEDAPPGDEWIHEIKFDGYRILARVDSSPTKNVRLLSRNGKDWTDRFGHIAALLENLPVERALLDGEVVAYAADGSTSFRRLQEALSEGRTGGLVYQAFDLLHLDGFDLTASPQLERKEALAALLASAGFRGSSNVRYTEHIVGKGPQFYLQACSLGLEGIISKRADARYSAGRTKGWLKVKCTRHVELLIGGFTDPAGSRNGFGALLLGGYDDAGSLLYAGRVGTGFSERNLRELRAQLEELETDSAPFDPPPPKRGVHWVKPVLVAEVEFTEWTRDGSLRHPTFRGLREDKEPDEIRLPPEARQAAQESGAGGRSAKGGNSSTRAGSTGARAGGGEGRNGEEGGRANRKSGASGKGGKTRGMKTDDAEVAGVRLSNPDRVLFPEQGVTKLALARYYEEIADWVLPLVKNRPLSLVRCPQGWEKQCFFQKHPGQGMLEDMARIEIEESDGPADYLYIRTLADIVSLVQNGVLELHLWGSRVDDVERPDILVFDLDPAPGVPWSEMLRIAKELRDRLKDLGLESFPRTTGGKGLHLVVPLVRKVGWEEAKAFAQGVANAHAADDRTRITTNMSKAKRKGRIFLDYLRNGRGATAIASYSTRSREGAPVAVPVRWDEVNAALRPDRYNIDNIRRRLSALTANPWEGFEESRKALTRKMLEAVGVH